MKKTKKILSVVLSLMIISIIPMSSITASAVGETRRTDYDVFTRVNLVSVESHGVVKSEFDLIEYDRGFAIYPDESTTLNYQIVVGQQTSARDVVIEEVVIYYDSNLNIVNSTYIIESMTPINIDGKLHKRGIIRDVSLPNEGSYAGRAEIFVSFESPLGYTGIFNNFYCEICSGDSKYVDDDSIPGNALNSGVFDLSEDDASAFTNDYNFQAAPYGLKYEVKEGKVYIIDYIGNKNIDCLYIPSEINGLPVYQINTSAFRDKTKTFKKVFIPSSVKNILSTAFSNTTDNESPSVQEVVISEGVIWIGGGAFYNCTDISRVNFPSTVSYISPMKIANSSGEFIGTYYGSVLSYGLYLYFEQPNPSLEEINTINGSYADNYFKNIKNTDGVNTFSPLVVNSEKIYTVNYNSSYNGGSWTAIETRPQKTGESVDLSLQSYCDGREFVGWNTDPNATVGLKNLQMGNGDVTLYAIYDTYNLGEETYSFGNFGDSDSPYGHCFGMSSTSAAYHNNILDITDIGGNTESDLYTLTMQETVKEPICHYQSIQGSYAYSSMVAGGSVYKNKPADIESDWEEVINYVKNNQYDDKGTLQIGFRKNNEGGHAINFLRYEVVDGQERIYAYDNNFPDIETYFCMNTNGQVYQKPYSTFSGAIDCICLRDINVYFELAVEYDARRYIYGNADSISISGAIAYPMECGDDLYTMFEIPDDIDQVIITPLVDNASFKYCDDEYSFNNVDDDTIGIFTLASDNDASMSANFIITNISFKIQQPSRNSIRNKDGIVLHANIDGTTPTGSYVEWSWNNSKFDVEKNSDGTLTIISENNGKTTFTATLYSADGSVLATDSIEMTSKAGFFDKIGGFFRSLFGTTKIYDA